MPNTTLPQTWTLEQMAQGIDPREESVEVVATAEQYERALQRAERTFRFNKGRRWVLKILREYIAAEVAAS